MDVSRVNGKDGLGDEPARVYLGSREGRKDSPDGKEDTDRYGVADQMRWASNEGEGRDGVAAIIAVR